MITVKERAELVQKTRRTLALNLPNSFAQNAGWRILQKKVDVIFPAVDLGNFALNFRGDPTYSFEQKVSLLRGEYMSPKLGTENDVHREVIDAMTCCVKVKIPDTLAHGLEPLLGRAQLAVKRMLADRTLSSSKHYADLIPCVISKSLITKYQRNAKCQNVRRPVLPVCGDKGRQIKLVADGIRVPALFKKEVLPVTWPRKVNGHVRNIECFKRSGEWFASICYSSPVAVTAKGQGCIGVDRNTVGNMATVCDPQNGKVKILGVSAGEFKYNFRRRKAKLMSQGRRRQVSQLRRKQERRTKYENHRTSKAIVAYAQAHCRAIAIENLGGVTADDSKIKKYTLKNQWAFTQLETFVRYKARLAGVSVIEVNPAFTSQECSRCHAHHKPSGKVFQCPSCGSKQHRDVNSGFVIARRGNDILSGADNGVENGAPLGPESVFSTDLLDGPLSGKVGYRNE
jgi:IS605 OrfB family transposase